MKIKDNRTENVKVRTTKSEYQAILLTADEKGCSVSKLLRSVCTFSDSTLPPETLEILRNYSRCQILNKIPFWDIPDQVKEKIIKELTFNA